MKYDFFFCRILRMTDNLEAQLRAHRAPLPPKLREATRHGTKWMLFFWLFIGFFAFVVTVLQTFMIIRGFVQQRTMYKHTVCLDFIQKVFMGV